MEGLSVLDIGSATGFFTFEAERRGADVTSVELPSLHDLDNFPGQSHTRILRRLAEMRVNSSQNEADPLVLFSSAKTYYYHLDAPFQYCYRALGSQAKRIYSTIYNLPNTEIAGKVFDYVLLGDVLLHLINPFSALAIAASFSRKHMLISQKLSTVSSAVPLIEYTGGDVLNEDDLCWFLPNERFFSEFCRKLGFNTVSRIGANSGCMTPTGYSYERPILLAAR